MPVFTPSDIGPPAAGGPASELWWFVRWFVFHGTRLDRLAVPDSAEQAAREEPCETRE